MSGKKKILICIFAVLTLAWTAIIFAQSAKNGEESTEDTNKLMQIIENIADSIGVDADVSAKLLRKSAHFGEYAVLGVFAALLIAMLGEKLLHIVSFGYAVSVAICDEFAIQRLSEGRAPQLTDVLIDSAGALFGILAFIGISCLVYATKKQENSSK